jgi:hypothetical protein
MLGLIFLGCASAADETSEIDGDIASAQQELWSWSSTQFWPNGDVPVCIDQQFASDPGYSEFVQRTRALVEGWYETAANINFTGWGACSGSTNGKIRLKYKPNLGGSWSSPNGYFPSSETAITTAQTTYGSYYGNNANVAMLHEFGHALGFEHEFRRQGTDFCSATNGTGTGVFHTAYDHDSIMNGTYCLWDPALSNLDRKGLIAVYGRADRAMFHAGGDPYKPRVLKATSFASSAYLLADVNGDETTDMVMSDGGHIKISLGGTASLVTGAVGSFAPWNLAAGEFNNQSGDEVLAKYNGYLWWLANPMNPNSTWTQAIATSDPMSSLRVGDFDGNGVSDVLAQSAGSLQVSWGAMSNWQAIMSTDISISEMAVGEFDGLLGDDVVTRSNGKYYYSSGASGAWQELSSGDVAVTSIRIGDFLGDGIDDLVTIVNNEWRIKDDGLGNWVTLNSYPADITDLKVGWFDGDNKADLFHTTND